jgi:hypothetical protein
MAIGEMRSRNSPLRSNLWDSQRDIRLTACRWSAPRHRGPGQSGTSRSRNEIAERIDDFPSIYAAARAARIIREQPIL